MTYIDVDTDALRAGATGHSSLSSAVAVVASLLGGVACKLDWEFEAAQAVEAHLRRLERLLSARAEEFRCHTHYLSIAADTYDRAETQLVELAEGFGSKDQHLRVTESGPCTPEAMQAHDQAMQEEMRTVLCEEGFTEEEWENASEDERKEMLERLGSRTADILGVPELPLGFEDMKPQQGGVHRWSKDGKESIALNMDILRESVWEKIGHDGPLFWWDMDGRDKSYEDSVNVLIHEYRHAYQDRAQLMPVDAETRDAWNEPYKDPGVDGFDAYYGQPVEVDARRFAEGVVAKPERRTGLV